MNKRNMVARVVADVLDNTIVLPKDADQATLYNQVLAAVQSAPKGDERAMEIAGRQALGLQTAKLEGRAPTRAPKAERPEAVPYEAVRTSVSQPERISDAAIIAAIEPRTGLRSLSVAVLTALQADIADALAWHKAHVTPVAGQPVVPAAIANGDVRPTLTIVPPPTIEVVSATTPVNLPIGAPVTPQTGSVPKNDVNPGAFTDNVPGTIVTETVVVRPAVIRKSKAAKQRSAQVEAPKLDGDAKARVLAALAGTLTPAQQAIVAAAL